MQGVPGAIVNDPDTAAAFGGDIGLISVGSGFDFIGREPFSIEAWIKPSLIDDMFRHVFTKQHRGTPKEGYALLVQVANGVVFERYVDDAEVSIKFPTLLPATAFTHIVGTYDGVFMRLYINGQQVNQTIEERPQSVVGEATVIGAASVTEQFFAGAIDEVAVYAAPLSAAHIHAHYLAGTAP